MATSVISTVLIFHYYWRIRKPCSSTTLARHNTIILIITHLDLSNSNHTINQSPNQLTQILNSAVPSASIPGQQLRRYLTRPNKLVLGSDAFVSSCDSVDQSGNGNGNGRNTNDLKFLWQIFSEGAPVRDFSSVSKDPSKLQVSLSLCVFDRGLTSGWVDHGLWLFHCTGSILFNAGWYIGKPALIFLSSYLLLSHPTAALALLITIILISTFLLSHIHTYPDAARTLFYEDQHSI